MHSDDVSPWLIRGVYLFGIALILHAVIDLSTTVWPVRVSEITWRYGFLGLGAGYLQTPILGLLFIGGTALWTGNLGLARGVGTLLLATSVILLASVGLFMLDVVQVRQLRPAEAQTAVLYGGLFQAVKYVLAALIVAAMGHGLRDSVRTAERGTPGPSDRRPLFEAKPEIPAPRKSAGASDPAFGDPEGEGAHDSERGAEADVDGGGVTAPEPESRGDSGSDGVGSSGRQSTENDCRKKRSGKKRSGKAD